MSFPPFQIFQQVQAFLFFFLISSSSYLFIFSLTPKTFASPLFFPFQSKSKILACFLSKILSRKLMAPKTSYILSGNMFILTRWIGATRLNEAPLQVWSTPISQCTAQIDNFFKLFLISSFSLIFHFNLFLDLKMLEFCCREGQDENFML